MGEWDHITQNNSNMKPKEKNTASNDYVINQDDAKPLPILRS